MKHYKKYRIYKKSRIFKRLTVLFSVLLVGAVATFGVSTFLLKDRVNIISPAENIYISYTGAHKTNDGQLKLQKILENGQLAKLNETNLLPGDEIVFSNLYLAPVNTEEVKTSDFILRVKLKVYAVANNQETQLTNQQITNLFSNIPQFNTENFVYCVADGYNYYAPGLTSFINNKPSFANLGILTHSDTELKVQVFANTAAGRTLTINSAITSFGFSNVRIKLIVEAIEANAHSFNTEWQIA